MTTQDTADIRLKQEYLQRYDLPDALYPIPLSALNRLLSDGDQIPFAVLLHGLQQRSQAGDADWQHDEPAMARLASLIASEDPRELVTVGGHNWWLEVGKVALDSPLITIQRGAHLIAAIRPLDDGRLRVMTFRPLDAKSAAYLISVSQNPDAGHGVCMRANNWEYALDCAAANGNSYAADRGEAYLAYWEKGLGLSSDGTVIPAWHTQRSLQSRSPVQTAIELGVHYRLGNIESLETPQQSDNPPPSPLSQWAPKRQQSRTVHNRFLGCLLGGAVGDALGASVEFMSRANILRLFGPRGLTDYAPAYGGLGMITDDTQMTLFTAEGLLRAWVRGTLKGITSYPAMTAQAYLRWLHTQDEDPISKTRTPDEGDGWLFQQHALHSRRAPGNTCLSALQQMTTPGEPAHNNSKGCGGVMRIAPVGLFTWHMDRQHAVQKTFRLGTELAALTHGHPTGSLTGGVLAVLVLALTDGASLTEGLAAAKSILCNEAAHQETLHALEQAEMLANSDLPHHEAISQLGQGWVAEEALAISVYCALVARNFKHGVLLAVNHDGDSDSTGAITGNLLGTMHGVKAIPAEWLAQLELRDVIEQIATDLYEFPEWGLTTDCEDGDLVDKIWTKYPGY